MILWIMNDEAVKETFEWCSYGSLKAPGILKINRSVDILQNDALLTNPLAERIYSGEAGPLL